MKDYLDFAVKELRSHGKRITRPKLAVLSVLETVNSPMKPYEIVRDLKAKGIKIDVVTAYRVLAAFKEMNLVHSVEQGFVACKHKEENCNSNFHLHFLCEKCKEISEIVVNKVDFLGGMESGLKNFSVNSHQFNVFGTCESCLSE